MEIDKMKVAELREELSKRKLDTKGNKNVLVSRLKQAVKVEEAEKAEEAAQPAVVEEEKAVVEEEKAVVEEPEEAATTVENGAAEEKAEEEAPSTQETPSAQETPAVAEKMEVEGTPKKEENAEESKDAVNNLNKNKQQRRGQKRRLINDDEPFIVNEDEPEIDDNAFVLDWYNSDLNMRINKETFLGGEPFFKDGWGYVWGGVKATHGFKTGKVCFEVKLIENLESKLEDEKNLHELRIGFSTDEPLMQMGESSNSFAYSGSGKKGTDSEFEEYGESFAKDDVVGAYLDMTRDSVTLTFSKNGVSKGEAFSFPRKQLNGQALFPHISSRNMKFEVNFGKALDQTAQEPWFAPVEGYQYVADVANRVRGPARIKDRKECEMIMLIGLPASGKTTWVNKHVSEHPEKRYTVVGTACLVDKMKVDGKPRKANHTGRWDLLIQKCTRCLQDWLRLASQRRRNIVIDQTNVYPNAQKRKVRPFEGMTRKAVIMVPSDEEYKVRAEAQEKADNKDVPDSAVMEMKANFALPADGPVNTTITNAEGVEETKEIPSPFNEIIFSELQREEAQKLIEEYNKDAKEKGYGKKPENKQKRKRGNQFRRGGRGNVHRGRGGGPPFRGLPFRGGPNGRGFFRGMMPMRGGPPMRGGGFMNRGQPPMNRNQPKFAGKMGGGGGSAGPRNQWGQSPWNQWGNRPGNTPVGGGNGGWGQWNQGGQNQGQGWNQNRGNQGFGNSNWGNQGNNQGFNQGFNQGYNQGGGNQGGFNQGFNQGYNQGYNNQGYPGNSNWGGGGYGGRR